MPGIIPERCGCSEWMTGHAMTIYGAAANGGTMAGTVKPAAEYNINYINFNTGLLPGYSASPVITGILTLQLVCS